VHERLALRRGEEAVRDGVSDCRIDRLDIHANRSGVRHRQERTVPRMGQVEFQSGTVDARLAGRTGLEAQRSRRHPDVAAEHGPHDGVRNDVSSAVARVHEASGARLLPDVEQSDERGFVTVPVEHDSSDMRVAPKAIVCGHDTLGDGARFRQKDGPLLWCRDRRVKQGR
jgi:hypothetical protein